MEMPGPDDMPLVIGSPEPSQRGKSNSQARFVERFTEPRVADRQSVPHRRMSNTSPSPVRKDSSYSRVHKDSSYSRRSQSGRDHEHRARQSSTYHGRRSGRTVYPDSASSEDTDFDPLTSGYRRVLPSLTLPFKINRVNVNEEEHTSASPHVDRQTDHQGAKEYRQKLYHENVTSVLHSRYKHGVFIRGDSMAELFTGNSQQLPGEGQRELLRWIQIEKQYPKLESLMDYVSHLDGLDATGKQDAMSILRQVRNEYEKTLHMPEGKQGRYLEPNVTVHSDLNSDDASERSILGRKSPALFFCMPYFGLAPYTTYVPSQTSTFHPLRTLLQSRQMSTPKKRDMQQAICDLQYPTKGYVFHVPQLWCLMLGDDTLITCIPSQINNAKQKRNEIIIKPASGLEGQPHLRVSDGGSRVWLLAVKKCTTWVEFVANFRELSLNLEAEYDIMFANDPQDAASWPSLISRARRTTVELRLRSKLLASYDDESSSLSDSSISEDTSSCANPAGKQPSRRVSTKSADLAESSSILSSGKSSGSRQAARAFVTSKEIRSETASTSPSKSGPTGAKATFSFASDRMNIFSWFAAVPDTSKVSNEQSRKRSQQDHNSGAHNSIKVKQSYIVDEKRIEETLSDMHFSLCGSNFKKHREYRKCPLGTIHEVDAKLVEIKKEASKAYKDPRERSTKDGQDDSNRAEQDLKESDHPQRSSSSSSRNIDLGDPMLREKRKLVRVAKALFQLFLPLEYTSDMVAKYWGSVLLLLQDKENYRGWSRSLSSGDGMPSGSPSRNGDIWNCKLLLENISQDRAPLPYDMKLPDGLVESWAHLVMFLILSTARQHRRQAFHELVKFRTLAYGSRAEIMKSLAKGSLHDREAVLPLGITLIMVKDLIGDVTFESPDITSIYLESCAKLNGEIHSRPYSREHQEKITRLRQEINCVIDVLRNQLDCVRGLWQRLTHVLIHNRSFQGQREVHILLDCISSIEGRIRTFEEIDEDAADLASWNISRIESNKDRHEAAVFVFTTVTVIFLPLSFVSSVFGMNTVDIRNMNKQQWIFWISAVPVTITVIGLSLFVIRYFEPAHEALAHFWSHGRNEEQTLNLLPVAPRLMDQPHGHQGRSMLPETYQEIRVDDEQYESPSRRRSSRRY